MNTPKSTLPVDDSIGDMGVIVEEDDAEKSSLVEDQNYGQELPCDEPDNMDYRGLKDLLKTPKNCSTPRFKGLREMMRTPKVPASPIFGNIEELLDNSIEGSPHQNKTSRSITVASVAVGKGNALEAVLKTPSARHIMVPNEPASAILKSRGDSLATTTEYDLGMTNTTLHLDQIFDDVPSTSVANMDDTETEINVTALSTASGLDPLKQSVSSEAPMSFCKLEEIGVASRKNDPLTSTTYKTAMQADLELSTTFNEEGEASSRPSSLSSNEMSGMQLLDQTSDSMFSEPLIVSGVDSCNVTVDETKALGQTTYQQLEINDVDTDSNVGLTEPLVLSDDDDEAEVVEDSRVTSKKSIVPTEISKAYNLEESVAAQDSTQNQAKSVNETLVKGETSNKENDSLSEEVSLIEVNESLAGDSISTTRDEKSLVIELDSSSDTDAEPTKENDESAAVELSIVDSETFPLDSTQEDDVDQKPVESGSEKAGIISDVPSSQIEDPLPSEEVLGKGRATDVALIDEVKGNDVSAAVDPESPPDATANSSVIVDERLPAHGEPRPIDSEEYLYCKTADDNVSVPVDSETLPLDSTADSHIVSTNGDQNPLDSESSITKEDSESSITKEDTATEAAKEDLSVINALPSKEMAEDGDNEKEKDVSVAVDSEILPIDSTADNSVIVEEEFITNIDQKPIDSELPKENTEDLPLIDASSSEEHAEDKITTDNPKETAADVESDISPLDPTADQTELPTNDDQKPNKSLACIANEDSTGNPQSELSIDSAAFITNEASEPAVQDQSVIDVLPSEESSTDTLAVDLKLSDETTDNMAVESLGQDAEPNTIESISTVTKAEADEISVSISDAEPSASESSLVAATNDNTAEKPKPEPEQISLDDVGDVESQRGDVDELPTSTTEPYIPDVEAVTQAEESALEASSAVQDTDLIDPAQEFHQREDEANTGIMEEVNPCGDQNEADKTQIESVCESESDKEAKTTIDQLSISESAHVTPADKSLLQEVAPQEESNAADIIAVDPQEEDVAAIDDLAVKEKNEDEINVNKTAIVIDESTSMETTQNESCDQEPVSPKVVAPKDNTADEENSPNTSSLIMESLSEQPKPTSTEPDPSLPPIQGESGDEVNKLDKSSIAEDAGEDSVEKESPKVKSSPNTPIVVAACEEMTTQQVEFKAIEESSDRLNKSKEIEETSVDTSEKSEEVAAEETSQDEAIADVLDSSVPLNTSSSSAAQDNSVAENTETSATDVPNRSISVDGAEDESATENPIILEPLITEEATVTSKQESEGQSPDRAASEIQQSKEAVEEIVSAELVSATDNVVKSLSETDNLTIVEMAKEAANPSVTEDEKLAKETSAQRSESNTSIREQPQPNDHHIKAKSPNQNSMPADPVKEVPDIVELSDESSSESPPIEEAHCPAPLSAAEAVASVPIEETPSTEDPKETKVDDVSEEGTPIAENRNTVKDTSVIIELSDDSSSESPPIDEDQSPAPVPASEGDALVATAETLLTEETLKVEDVPEEGTPIGEDLNTNNGPDSEANASVSIAKQDPDQDEERVEDVSAELQNVATAAPVTNQEELAEKPQASEKLASADVVADETTSITKSVANIEVEEKSQHKSEVESSAVIESPSKEKDEPSEDVSSTVELDLEHVQDIEASKQKASSSENIEQDKLATPLISSSEPETSDQFIEPIPEASESLKHSTMEAMHTDPQSIRHEDEPSDKETLKPGKRATRKASASVETPSEVALEKTSRRARKPSAEVEEIQSNDFHDKPKRRILHKEPEKLEAMTPIQDKEEDVLKVIPEEPHSSRANEENEPQTEAVFDQKQEEDALDKPKRRVRKPSEKAKAADITEKPKRRARKPSAEVSEPVMQAEEQAHSSNSNKLHDLQEEDSSQKQGVEIEKERLQNKEEIAEELDEQNEPEEQVEEQPKKSKETKKTDTERPKRRGRKASEDETDTMLGKKPKMDDLLDVIEEKDTPTSTQIEQEQEAQKPEKAKRRGRKASAEEDTKHVVPPSEEVLKSIVEEDNESNAISIVDEEPQEVRTEVRSRRRGRKPSKEEVVEVASASQAKSSNGNEEKPLAAASEDQPSSLTEPNGPKKRTRKSLEFVPADVHETAKETDLIERPKRRGRKPSVDIEHVEQDVPGKSRRRGRTPAEPEKQPSGDAMDEEPDKKTRRIARKPSTETVNAVAPNIEEHLKDIEEVAEPEPEPEAATAATTPLQEEEEPKTRRRGRNVKLEMTAKNTAEVGHSRLRGRKATEDDVHKSTEQVGVKTIPEEQHNIVPADSNNEVEAEVAATAKPKRRVRKASANVDEGTPVAKKATIRRGRKEDTQENHNEQKKQIDLQQVPTESMSAVVMMSGDIDDGAVGSEDDLTPRRREGRNMPRKNYDETSDEDKQRSARRPRKPAPSKLLALKAPEDVSTPQSKQQPVEEVETPVNTLPITEPTSTQRREGRNVPRKNYTEVPDDDKPTTSRNRRVRNLSAKALELIVDSSPRPITPKGRKTKATTKDEIPAKRASLEAAPPTQPESVAEEEPTPVITKGRATRRKADDDLSDMVAAPPAKRGVRGQHEESVEQPEAKPASKNARSTGRKAKVESDPDELVPTKKPRGGSRAKTPVKPAESKSGTETEEHSPPTKKGRGGTRAKTPVGTIPEDTPSKPEDEPAKKPSARSRARGGAKAVAVVEQPLQDSDVELVLPATTASRGGRAKKVHFEPTETAPTAAASAEDAPKRATRSRRK
ncbi:hypothetical protein KR032_003438 [Drosophila birchii]|nr:hypothetical protein KR032_003438 [Drosophila birchii]